MDLQKMPSARPRKSTNGRAESRGSLGRELVRGAVRLGSRIAPYATAGFLVDQFTRTHRRVQRAEDLGDVFVFAERFQVEHEGRTLRGHTFRPEGTHPAYEGDGPRVLLVHGWDGGSHQLAPYVRPLVERGYTVSTFDLPAHGASDGERTNLRELADALARVAAHLGPIEALIAHSVGAGATALAMMEGLEVGRVVFVAPPTSLEIQARAFAHMAGAEEDALGPMLTTLRGILGRPIDAGSWLRGLEGMRAPLLVVHDRRDRITSFEGSTQIVSHWPGARLIPTEGLGHARILRDPQVVAAIVDFVHARVAP